MGRTRRLPLLAALAAAPGLVALAQGGAFATRAAIARRGGRSIEPGVPTPAPSAGLVGAVAVDSLINMGMRPLSSLGSAARYRAAADEVDAAVAFYAAAGWLDDTRGRHPAPSGDLDAEVDPASGRSGGLEMLRFESGWHPQEDEPAGERWDALAPNGVVPVRLLRHPGKPRPWLVAIHGQGMGRPADLRMLRVWRLHKELGINIALPILPLHGPRAAGLAPDRQFVSNVHLVNNVLGLTQSVWDVRRLLGWLRADQAAPAVGVLGLSLGSYVTSLLSTLEDDLACVLVVVPTSDLAGALRSAVPLTASRARLHRALHDDRSTTLHRVVSPLARPCLVPHDRRYLVAGQADRIAPPAGAARLWEHWGRPSIEWRPRGHVTTAASSAFDRYLAAAFTASGLTEQGRR